MRSRSRTSTRTRRSNRIQRADLDELIAEELPIYVTNTSGNDSVSLVIFNNPSTGDVIPIEIPAQKVPWCVSDLLSRDVIKGSTDFRKYIADGNLSVLDPDYAQDWSEQPKTARLIQRLRTAKKKRRGKNTNRGKVNRKVIELDPRVESIIARLTAGNMKTAAQRAAIDSLELISEHLDQPEFAYIMQHGQECDMLTEWAVQEMGRDVEGVELDDSRPSRRQPRRRRTAATRANDKRNRTGGRSQAKPKASSSKKESSAGLTLNVSQKNKLRAIQSRLQG